MVICVDVDNVLNNLVETALDDFSQETGRNYVLDDITCYDLHECLPSEVADELLGFIFPYVVKEDKISVSARSREVLQRLVDEGHQVYIATATAPENYLDRHKWIKRNFPFMSDDHIINVAHKWMLRCDVMIEDNLHNLLKHPYCERICFDNPWNRNVHDEAYGIHRVTSWTEVLEIINQMMTED